MRLEDLDFDLPEDLIAQHPAAERDACRLMHVRRAHPELAVHAFTALADLLRPGDLLVLNATRVIPARLQATRAGGGRCELLLVDAVEPRQWWTLARPARALGVGSVLRLQDGSTAHVAAVGAGGMRLVQFAPGTTGLDVAARLGEMPLPPYIRRAATAADRSDYQTVFARVDGSVAAPTAGLHFTEALLQTLQQRGVQVVTLVLHVGPGTFAPLRDSDPRAHPMHWERFEVERTTLERATAARAAGGRIVAVGTTVARVLESVGLWETGDAGSTVEITDVAGTLRGRTRIFIHPPFRFQRIDALLTNFHLPRSTLLLLVDAFAGRDTIRRAYAEAVRQRLRFFSYGDAMLIE